MTPLEIWCNKAQERYVLAIAKERLELFERICARERCPYAVVGHATDDGRLVVTDALLGLGPIDMPLARSQLRAASEGKWTYPCVPG